MTSRQDVSSAKSVGRIVGLLFLAQVLLAPPVYTEAGMMKSVMTPGFLANAAGNALQIRVALLLVFVLSALTLAVALTAMPVFRWYSERLALLFLALSVIGLATQAVESVATQNMVSMSLMYVKDGAPKELLETLGPMARAEWSSSHFTNLMLGHVKLLVLYVILFRFALVPRVLAAVGVAASLLSITGATMPMLGYQFSYLMVMPAGLTLLALTLWLIVKGFKERVELSGA